MKHKHKLIAVIMLAIAVSGAFVWSVCRSKADFHWLNGFLQKPSASENGVETVSCELVFNMGIRNILRFKLVIPCEDKIKKSQLVKIIPKLKSDMLIHIDQKEMARWVRDRNFPAMKNALLKIVNRNARQPVKEVYFDNFNY